MKHSYLSLLLVFVMSSLPGWVSAQQPSRMDAAEMMRRLQDPAVMERMMREAEAAQKCMEEIDTERLEGLEKRARAMQRELEQLCAAGKSDEALSKAIEFSREVRDDAMVKKVRECADTMKETMKLMPYTQLDRIASEPASKDDDVCDGLARRR